MSARRKVIGRFVLFFLAVIMISSRGRSQGEAVAEMHVVIVGFADRWADYGSKGDTPSFRDFLAIRSQPGGRGGAAGEFIKLRLLYWPQDNSDPKRLAEGPSRGMSFAAAREETCDETFSSLSRSKQVSYLDPELRPSRFLFLAKAPSERPRPSLILPCYQVK
jgi:hypothetical protein